MSFDARQPLHPRFGSSFLEDYGRLIMTDPKIAMVELIANCWDAGANRIDIVWPDPAPDTLFIGDNGTGMTYDEFTRRWLELNYSRKEAQGEYVTFPPGNQPSHRKAFGRNGKGRLSMFCFANEYVVETWRDGKSNRFKVKRNSSIASTPFEVALLEQTDREGHGTEISAELVKNHLEIRTVRDLIGSKFITDPTFEIYLNQEKVELTDLQHLVDKTIVPIQGIGVITISCIDSRKVGKTSKQHGVAWWVNKRLVGEASWKGFDEDAYLDARTSEAKRYTFVVEADILADDVREDWSEFKDTERFRKVNAGAKNAILKLLRQLMADEHKSVKLAVLSEHKKDLRGLATDSRHHIGEFIDSIQTRMPTINQKVLSTTVEVLSNLEKARSKFALLEQLAKLKPNDLDTLNEILASWSVQEARIEVGCQ